MMCAPTEERAMADRSAARNEWECGLHRPVAVGRVEIGVAYAADRGFGFMPIYKLLGRMCRVEELLHKV
jgi:hypothetical protein